MPMQLNQMMHLWGLSRSTSAIDDMGSITQQMADAAFEYIRSFFLQLLGSQLLSCARLSCKIDVRHVPGHRQVCKACRKPGADDYN